jgi:1,4-alpha-glucan branching enzyme
MGWMNDSLQYMHEDPVHRRWHHDKITFSLVYAFSENFMLPLSHDEVVHGKGSLLAKMPGDEWQRFANLRAYYGFMWGHPGKKLLFMGQEFAQPTEWRHDQALPWSLLEDARHAGIQRLVHDLNALYRDQPALHAKDCEPEGFQWLNGGDADNSVLSWLRSDGNGNAVIVLSNMTPVPRPDYRIGLPEGVASRWQEALNTDSHHYGGSDAGNIGAVLQIQNIASDGHARSLTVTLPPLSTVFLVPSP